ncbi:hypothetical protein BJF79_06300 [Actinomadura sp. CNU-125]|uniref:hypothetical protein n=1 Tax=Actinomadura sp. CNU-125 TaxID=1904961 RepID=UPI00095CA1AC|nr:hypothetical protein [Actinomadura sp. CNU-125]OLT36981.1 hypothetical protein BJF79_06300 [Actinomadura sp. CNU-125]
MSTPAMTKEADLTFLRIAVTLQTVVVFVQAITAGLLLSSPDIRVLHSAGSYGLFFVVLLHLVVAILMWRRGGGSPKPILYAGGFFALTLGQIALGIAHVKTLHVPLGVLMFGMSVLQAVWIWTDRRGRTAAAA